MGRRVRGFLEKHVQRLSLLTPARFTIHCSPDSYRGKGYKGGKVQGSKGFWKTCVETLTPHSRRVHPSLLTVSDEGADPVLQMREQSDTAAVIRGSSYLFPLKKSFKSCPQVSSSIPPSICVLGCMICWCLLKPSLGSEAP